MRQITSRTAVVLVICSILCLLFVSCKQTTGPDFGGAEFAGIWVYDVGFVVETLTITTTTFEVQDTGSINGTIRYSITSYDENVDHILMSVTSTSGDYVATAPIGTVVYTKYSISGNELFVYQDTSGYPANATKGPYVKQ